MPKLWKASIEAHRQEVRAAIEETTAALVAQRGLRSVTMSQIAAQTGIGRATLYKYFSGIEAILHARHDRQVAAHFQQLIKLRDQAGSAGERLAGVLEGCALIIHEHRNTELSELRHQGEQFVRAQQHLNELIRELIAKASESGEVRDDVAPGELASYCLHAVAAARSLPSKAAVRRLVKVTLAGLHPRV